MELNVSILSLSILFNCNLDNSGINLNKNESLFVYNIQFITDYILLYSSINQQIILYFQTPVSVTLLKSRWVLTKDIGYCRNLAILSHGIKSPRIIIIRHERSPRIPIIQIELRLMSTTLTSLVVVV